MSKYWKPSINGKKDFENVYRKYKSGLMTSTEGAYHCGIKKFNFDFQEPLTDVLYRTCLYIIRNQDEIDDEEKLVWFSLKRKCKDIRYEKTKNKELKILDKIIY